MLTLKTNKMELRGVQTQVSKKGNSYYIVYCEDVDSCKPFQFFCKEFNALPQGLKKGDMVEITVEYNSFKELSVVKVSKVS